MGTTNRPPARTVITCTKSEFHTRLRNAFATGIVFDRAQSDELDQVIEGLVRQAEQRGGAYSGYNAYLDCQFTVMPDEYMIEGGELGDVNPDLRTTANPVAGIQRLGRALRADEITIPAVTTEQRDQSRTAAAAIVTEVTRLLRALTTDDNATAVAMDDLAVMLKAAAGHLRIANGDN